MLAECMPAMYVCAMYVCTGRIPRRRHFVTDEDLHGQNVIHVKYTPATCLLKNQSLSLILFRVLH